MKTKSHSISGAFVFTLLGIFAVFSMLLVVLGAQAYRTTVDGASAHTRKRIAAAFVRNAVRAQDERGAIAVEDRDGLPVLALSSEWDGERYVQYIYGYQGQLCELFTACKRYEVAPGDLLDGAEKAGEDSLLANKLTELALLYGETENYISGRYMDSEDMFAALIQNLPSSPIAGAEVVIDDFDLLTDQLYHLMAAMTKLAE